MIIKLARTFFKVFIKEYVKYLLESHMIEVTDEALEELEHKNEIEDGDEDVVITCSSGITGINTEHFT